jgi:hypothetical protein
MGKAEALEIADFRLQIADLKICAPPPEICNLKSAI